MFDIEEIADMLKPESERARKREGKKNPSINYKLSNRVNQLT